MFCHVYVCIVNLLLTAVSYVVIWQICQGDFWLFAHFKDADLRETQKSKQRLKPKVKI